MPGSDLLGASGPRVLWKFRGGRIENGFDDSFIYGEIAQPLAQRKIPMMQMMRQEALTAFQAWKQKPDKTPY